MQCTWSTDVNVDGRLMSSPEGLLQPLPALGVYLAIPSGGFGHWGPYASVVFAVVSGEQRAFREAKIEQKCLDLGEWCPTRHLGNAIVAQSH